MPSLISRRETPTLFAEELESLEGLAPGNKTREQRRLVHNRTAKRNAQHTIAPFDPDLQKLGFRCEECGLERPGYQYSKRPVPTLDWRWPEQPCRGAGEREAASGDPNAMRGGRWKTGTKVQKKNEMIAVLNAEHWKNPNRHIINYVTREGEPPGCLRANCCYKFNYSRVAVARKLLCRGLIETEEADAVDADTAVRALIAKSQALSTLP